MADKHSCGTNNSGTKSETGESESKDIDVAEKEARRIATAKADTARLAFINKDCPNTDKENCPDKTVTDKGSAQLVDVHSVYDKDKKKWKSTATAEWSAIVDCNPRKKQRHD